MYFSLSTKTLVAAVGFLLPFSVCLSVFVNDISKTDAAKIIKINLQMFRDKFWKSNYFGVKKVKGQGHESQNRKKAETINVIRNSS